MLIEALHWYVESVSSFWAGLARIGIVDLLLIWLLVYWIFCRPRRRWRRRRWRAWYGCGCGCCCPFCGHRCEDDEDDEDDDEAGGDDDAEAGEAKD